MRRPHPSEVAATVAMRAAEHAAATAERTPPQAGAGEERLVWGPTLLASARCAVAAH